VAGPSTSLVKLVVDAAPVSDSTCRACLRPDDSLRGQATNGLVERVGSLRHAQEIIPGLLWIGDKDAATRKYDPMVSQPCDVLSETPGSFASDVLP
jgi:hypothetical protein